MQSTVCRDIRLLLDPFEYTLFKKWAACDQTVFKSYCLVFSKESDVGPHGDDIAPIENNKEEESIF